MLSKGLHQLVRRLIPMPRSLTGSGTRATLAVLAEHLAGDGLALQTVEVPTGTPVLDWVVPPEWNVREAWLEDADGGRVVDVADHPLHVVGYSSPIDATVALDELRGHLFTVPAQPDVIPYRTSYYNENWGFCLPHRRLQALPAGDYRVRVDTTLEPGSLNYGELFVPGASRARRCWSPRTSATRPWPTTTRPGWPIAAELARHVAAPRRNGSLPLPVRPRHHRRDHLAGRPPRPRRAHPPGSSSPGSVTPAGHVEAQPPRQRRRSTSRHAVRAGRNRWRVPRRDFSPYGYDERQYCSPGFDLPVGRFGRGQHGEYPEYHTSADDLAFVDEPSLDESWRLLRRFVEVLEANRTYRNLQPYGEPQLGRRGLYRSIGSTMDPKAAEMGLLWVLSLADGSRSVLDISRRSGLPFDVVQAACRSLLDADLLAAD